jgi:hypothetical protein
MGNFRKDWEYCMMYNIDKPIYSLTISKSMISNFLHHWSEKKVSVFLFQIKDDHKNCSSVKAPRRGYALTQLNKNSTPLGPSDMGTPCFWWVHCIPGHKELFIKYREAHGTANHQTKHMSSNVQKKEGGSGHHRIAYCETHSHSAKSWSIAASLSPKFGALRPSLGLGW